MSEEEKKMKSIMGLMQHRLARVFCVSLAAVVALMISQGWAANGVADRTADGAESFDDYLVKVRSAAIGNGIASETVDAAFRGLTRDERVIGYDRKQPEFVQTFDEYLTARVTNFRKKEGRKLFELHQPLLDEIAGLYGVDPEYIVAFWGLETSFGRYQGKYSIIRSLATLGHDQRRAAFFTAELLKALQILDEQHVAPEAFVGAWAGAMGQSQFMPSSFLRFAVDHDGDGRKDIWSNKADVFASIANYLNKAGWKRGAGWGGPASFNTLDFVSLKPLNIDPSCRALKHHSRKMSISNWKDLGVVPGVQLVDQPYALVSPEAGANSGYLVGGNYRAILNYNCANKYAVSVGLMSEAIATPD
jgi:membrane-bound lytic murein transglycosylase B